MAQAQISPESADLLRAVYLLKERSPAAPSPAAVEDRARSLRGEPVPKAQNALRALVKENLATQDKDKNVSLTRKGQTLAESYIRRQRLTECMLAELLDMPLESVHARARQIAPALPNDALLAISDKLGDPPISPYGQPIPGSSAPQVKEVQISYAPKNAAMIVSRIPEDDPDLIRHLAMIGIVPNARIIVGETSAIMGVVYVSVNNASEPVAMGEKVAERVWGREPEEEESARDSDPGQE